MSTSINIKKTANGYQVITPEGRYQNGRIKYKRELFKTKEEAHQRKKELLKNGNTSNALLDVPFTNYAKKWLRKKKLEITLRTWERYESIINQHLIPVFGEKSIDNITEDEVINYFLTHHNSGTTLRQHHTILKNIFKSEEIDIMKNIKCPRKNDTEINCIKDPDELVDFVNSFKNSILYLPVYLAAVTGMRLSEIAGLRWNDVNFTSKLITVNRSLHWEREAKDGIKKKKKKWYIKSTKNGSSRRSITISDVDVEVLKHYKTPNTKTNDFICLDGNGEPLYNQTFSSNFKARAKARGYDISFHSLRHSHATLLIQHYRKSINAVSKRLGHKDEVTTLMIYTSVLPCEDEDIAETLGGLFCK